MARTTTKRTPQKTRSRRARTNRHPDRKARAPPSRNQRAAHRERKPATLRLRPQQFIARSASDLEPSPSSSFRAFLLFVFQSVPDYIRDPGRWDWDWAVRGLSKSDPFAVSLVNPLRQRAVRCVSSSPQTWPPSGAICRSA